MTAILGFVFSSMSLTPFSPYRGGIPRNSANSSRMGFNSFRSIPNHFPEYFLGCAMFVMICHYFCHRLDPTGGLRHTQINLFKVVLKSLKDSGRKCKVGYDLSDSEALVNGLIHVVAHLLILLRSHPSSTDNGCTHTDSPGQDVFTGINNDFNWMRLCVPPWQLLK
eukprot:sb/3472479/